MKIILSEHPILRQWIEEGKRIKPPDEIEIDQEAYEKMLAHSLESHKDYTFEQRQAWSVYNCWEPEGMETAQPSDGHPEMILPVKRIESNLLGIHMAIHEAASLIQGEAAATSGMISTRMNALEICLSKLYSGASAQFDQYRQSLEVMSGKQRDAVLCQVIQFRKMLHWNRVWVVCDLILKAIAVLLLWLFFSGQAHSQGRGTSFLDCITFQNAAGAEVTAPCSPFIVKEGTGITFSVSGQTVTFTGASASPLTTKGDLYTFSTVNARLPVGGNGLCLTAQAAQTTGLLWAACAAGGGITTLNTLVADPQLFATGTAGADFAISSAVATHTFNIPSSSGANRGLLLSADWTTFNNKQATLSTSAAIANQFLTAFTAPDTFSRAQPAFSNLSGSATCAQLPALTGDSTTVAGNCAVTGVNLPDGETAAGHILFTDIAAPVAPGAAKLKIFGDSTDLRFHDKNAAGTIGTTVVADTGAASNFLTAVSVSGVISKARPAIADLSDGTSVVQTTRSISTTAPLAGGGDLSANRTFSITGAAGQVLAGSGPAFTATPTLGTQNSVQGTLTVAGSAAATGQLILNISGAAANALTISPGANAGAVALTGPTTGGTIPSAATSPVTLSAAGAIACATCVTSSGGGAETATAPVTISAAGLIACATCATTTNGGALSGTAPIAISAAGAISITSPLPIANGGLNITTAQAHEWIFPAAGCSNVTASSAFDLPTASAPTVTCFGTTTTQGVQDFVDGSTTGSSIHFRLPTGWTGAVDAVLVWFANAASANAVRWSVATGCVADSEAISTGPSYNAASASNTAYTGTANQRKSTTLSAVAVTNCAAAETMYVQVQRIGADGGDTLAATAELLEMTVIIRITPQV